MGTELPPPVGIDAQKITEDAHRVAVDIDVSEILGRLEREALTAVEELSRQGLVGDALADAVADRLRNLSDAPIEKAARGAASEAFNLGRNLEAQVRADDIERVVRTEILDENTCPPCRELDGKMVAMNSDDYFKLMPPNKCDGRELCRGFYLYMAEAA